jgi:glycosyltransferase involved in cell wall biosynthesis
MGFSDTIDDIASVRAGKIVHLAQLIRSIHRAQKQHRAELLYYPPAGPNRVPVYRDVAVLLATRHLFRHTVFHYHAGGLSELRAELTPPERWLFDRAYGEADAAILLSEHNPPDGERLGARQTIVVPYGIDDDPPPPIRAAGNDIPVILFVGAVRASKGVDTLLSAADRLRTRERAFVVEIVGPFASAAYETKARTFVAQRHLTEHVRFVGELTGAAKWERYAAADIFCFPTHYASETFGLVVLEAMRFGLPVVASRWRGVASLVDDGASGFLVAPRDAEAVVDRLDALVADAELRHEMGVRGRARYEADFTIDRWYARMEAALLAAAERE